MYDIRICRCVCACEWQLNKSGVHCARKEVICMEEKKAQATDTQRTYRRETHKTMCAQFK